MADTSEVPFALLSPSWHPTHCPLCGCRCLNFISLCIFSALSYCHRCLQSSLLVSSHQHSKYPTSIFPFFAFLHHPLLVTPFSCQAREPICPPALKHYTFSPFPQGLKSCRVSLGLHFVPQLSHYTQEQKCHSSGQELGQWQKLLCARFTAVHLGKANVWGLHGLTTSMTTVVYPIPYPYNWRSLYLISIFCSWLSCWQSLNWCRAAAIAFRDILPCRKAGGKWQIRFPRRSTSYSSAMELFWNKKHFPCWQT